MTSQKIRIFVSSGMLEFKQEREKIKNELKGLYDVFIFEKDAGARAANAGDVYTDELYRSDLYIGIFGQGYGEYTIDEYEKARNKNIDCLVYVKNLQEGEERDDRLTDLINEVSDITDKKSLTIYQFDDIEDLIDRIRNDVGNWSAELIKISRDRQQKPILVNEAVYKCDRVDQYEDFHDLKTDELFNFFIVHGEKKQSHLSLVKRFSIDETSTENNVKTPITIRDKETKRLKITILRELFNQFGLKENQKFSLKVLGKFINQEGIKKVFIVFRIEEELLLKKNVIESIRWFTKEYCDKKKLPDNPPKFYFFLNILYGKKGMSKKSSIKKQLKSLKEYTKLRELDDVNHEHLKQWLEGVKITHNSIEQENIINEYFTEDKFPMELVELRLKKMIKNYNENQADFEDIMLKTK